MKIRAATTTKARIAADFARTRRKIFMAQSPWTHSAARIVATKATRFSTALVAWEYSQRRRSGSHASGRTLQFRVARFTGNVKIQNTTCVAATQAQATSAAA